MSFQKTTYHSRIYRDFKAIPSTDYRRIVRFYERFEKSILTLDFDEYFDLLVAYSRALFEISEYQKCILMSETVIHTSIMDNITHINGEEIYCNTLFRKAAAHYNLYEYAETEHILQELLKLQPYNPLSIMLLEKTLRKKETRFIQNIRAATIFLLLMAAMTIAIELLLVRPFFEKYTAIIENGRNSMFALGLFVLIGGTLLHYWRVHWHVKKTLRHLIRTKSMNRLLPPQ
jgi:hypothetical protein